MFITLGLHGFKPILMTLLMRIAVHYHMGVLEALTIMSSRTHFIPFKTQDFPHQDALTGLVFPKWKYIIG